MKPNTRALIALLISLAGGCAGYVRYVHQGQTIEAGIKYTPPAADLSPSTATASVAEQE